MTRPDTPQAKNAPFPAEILIFHKPAMPWGYVDFA